VNLRKTRKR